MLECDYGEAGEGVGVWRGWLVGLAGLGWLAGWLALLLASGGVRVPVSER